jgi:hypothetical protein
VCIYLYSGSAYTNSVISTSYLLIYRKYAYKIEYIVTCLLKAGIAEPDKMSVARE